MERTTPASLHPLDASREEVVEPLERDESRQLLYFHGRLVLEHYGFSGDEIGRLGFFKWLYLRSPLSEFPEYEAGLLMPVA